MQFKPPALLAAITGSLVASSSLSVAGQLVINTPDEAVQCVPTVIDWAGAPGMFMHYSAVALLIRSTPPVLCKGPFTLDSFTWQTNVRAGTQVSLRLNDAAGDVAQSAPFVIKDGRK
ncbi:hypothetical protein NUW54_g3973 [Trametes sanguinea]|uniref:Uncharacterized protein n=1 Tax=Trametes sanguinea TaxID=158606 RepID=A0ACC1Q1R7_9APHY|nr:hypothetical protein NUW54_g3973 [Trametes sanguinea]